MHWNDDSGDWQGLSSPEQVPRYKHLAQLVGVGRRVLDVGCGEGVLKHFLHDVVYSGIEPSAKAASGDAEIIRATAERFESVQKWDCIVFNEVLYYSTAPIYLLQKYRQFLNPNGRILISIYQNPLPVSFKKRLLHLLDPIYPMGNVHCSQMVDKFLSTERWTVRSEVIANRWRIWDTLPR